jgi:hypothetical protein
MPAEPIREYAITEHAAFEMSRRGIDEAMLRSVLAAPGQRESVRPGRDVLQTLMTIEDKEYVIRVFVDIDRTPANVVTAYRTSKIRKYWRDAP